MELKVLDINGKETGESVSLAEEVFAIEPNDHAIYLDVKQYLANQRQGTHKAKERGEITGSTRKLKRQKGTGTARAGSIKSPVFKGGGRIFGPRPRDYHFKLNKKIKVLARKSALSYKARQAEIVVLDSLTFDEPRTKAFATVLKSLSLDSKKTLVITPDVNQNVYLSCRNLPKAQVIPSQQINTYQVLNAEHLVLTKEALAKIETMLKS
ncbi:MAG: 50S ribosomal protein L4 [Microscillaceae bacterium]